MNVALVAVFAMLAVLGAVFLVASHPGGPDGWVARLGRGGLVAVLLAAGVAVVGVSIVLLPEAMVVGTALLTAGLLMLLIGALAAARGRPSDRHRLHAPGSDRRPIDTGSDHDDDES